MSSSDLSSELSDAPDDASTAGTSPPDVKPTRAIAKSSTGRKRKAEESPKTAKPPKSIKKSKIVEEEVVKTQAKRGAKAATTEAKTVKAEKLEVDEEEASASATRSTPKKASGKAKARKIVEEKIEVTAKDSGDEDAPKKKVIKKRKTKEEKEAEMVPLAARTVGSKIFAGAHVSIAGGVHKSVPNSVHIGGNAFALFLKSQRKWTNPALKLEDAAVFMSHCKDYNIASDKHVVPHGSYLVNLAHTDADRTIQAYESFLDDLKRCNHLGIQLYNFHPGNCASSTRDEALKHIAYNLNRAHKDPDTGTVVTLLETMASAGNTIGSTFEELATIISHVTDKSRVGVCLDTCHVFAAGYDLRTPEAFKDTIEKFDKIIGLKYLRAFHVNDSKAPFKSHKDLHANIGTGFLGLRAFHNLVNDSRLWGHPLVLETPISRKNEAGKEIEDHSIYAREIKLLEDLVGMDVESEKFKNLERELHASGASERARIQDQVARKAEKDNKKSGKGQKKTAKDKKRAKAESDDDLDSGEDTA